MNNSVFAAVLLVFSILVPLLFIWDGIAQKKRLKGIYTLVAFILFCAIGLLLLYIFRLWFIMVLPFWLFFLVYLGRKKKDTR
jgi:Ca2+/H+ antiporter